MNGGQFWPWWLGAVSLALVTVGCCVVARRPLGVSGILARFVSLRDELEAERRRRVMDANAAALEAALLAATAEAFGPAAPGAPAPGCSSGAAGAGCGARGGPDVPAIGGAPRGCADCGAAGTRPSLAVHAVFLGAVVLGGLVVQVLRGGWRPTLDMGPTFASLFGSGPLALAALAVGGLLVGVGTSVSGGCSTGHGLSGASRLQGASLAATASFFATAVVVSFLLEGALLR